MRMLMKKIRNKERILLIKKIKSSKKFKTRKIIKELIMMNFQNKNNLAKNFLIINKSYEIKNFCYNKILAEK